MDDAGASPGVPVALRRQWLTLEDMPPVGGAKPVVSEGGGGRAGTAHSRCMSSGRVTLPAASARPPAGATEGILGGHGDPQVWGSGAETLEGRIVPPRQSGPSAIEPDKYHSHPVRLREDAMSLTLYLIFVAALAAATAYLIWRGEEDG